VKFIIIGQRNWLSSVWLTHLLVDHDFIKNNIFLIRLVKQTIFNNLETKETFCTNFASVGAGIISRR